MTSADHYYIVLEGKLPGIIIIIIIFIRIIIISIIIILSLKASFPACSNLSPSSSAWKRQLCFQLCLRWMFLQGLESRDSVFLFCVNVIHVMVHPNRGV